MDLMLFAKALESLESSSKRSIERREKIERAVLERQAKAAERVARERACPMSIGKRYAGSSSASRRRPVPA
jgi:hypothetical protein